MATTGADFLQVRDSHFILFGLGSTETSWCGVALLTIVYLGSLAFAAVLTLPAYRLVEWWNAHALTLIRSETASWLTSKAPTVFLFLHWLPIIAVLPWFLRWIFAGPRSLVLPINASTVRMWAYSFGLGLAFVVLLVVLQNILAPMPVRLAGHWLTVLVHPIALFKGLFEETIFCGLILCVFYTATRRPWLALTLTAALFAHEELNRPYYLAVVGPTVGWDTGWIIAFSTIVGPIVEFDVMRFTVLFLMGMVLGAVTLRTRSVWPAIGLHTGIVYGILSFKKLYGIRLGDHTILDGISDAVNSWMVAVALGVIFLAIVLWKPNAPSIAAARS